MADTARRVGLEFKILETEYIISLATSTPNGLYIQNLNFVL